MTSADTVATPRVHKTDTVMAPSGRLSFEDGVIDLYVEAMTDWKLSSLRVRESQPTDPISVVFVKEHEDVVDVLKNEGDFSLCHYAPRFRAVSPPHAVLLMQPESAVRTLRYQILDAAAARTPWFYPGSPQLKALARPVVDRLLDTFYCRAEPEFDVLGEFGGLAPFLIAREVFGLAGPAKPDLLGWLITQAQALPRMRRFTPETQPYWTQMGWSQVVFAQILQNFENRNWLVRLIAPTAEDNLRMLIAHRWKHCDPDRADPGKCDLLSAFKLVRREFPKLSEKQYERHVTYLMLELAGTALAVPALAFGTVVERMAVAAEKRAGQDKGKLPLEELTESTAAAFVNEALRLSPPTRFLLRRATRAMPFAGLELKKGEYVCALIKDAGLGMPDAHQIALDRSPKEYLHFDPQGSPHHCFGRWIATSMLGEMLLGLQSVKGLRTTGDTPSWAGLPNRRVMRFEREARDTFTASWPRRRVGPLERWP